MSDKREQALEEIRRLIFSGRLKPGSMTSERQLGEELGMSRPPIREALAILEYLSLVAQHPQKGAEIRVIEREETLEVLRLQRSLEAELVEEFVWEEANTDEILRSLRDMDQAAASDGASFLQSRRAFHRSVALGAGFKSAAVTIGGYEDREHLFRCRFAQPLFAQEAHEIFREHEGIVAGLQEGRELAVTSLNSYFVAEKKRIQRDRDRAVEANETQTDLFVASAQSSRSENADSPRHEITRAAGGLRSR